MKAIPYIPYFQTSRYRVATMVELAKIKPLEKAADLGTGDGRIAIALAKAGAIVSAYELDEKMIKIAQENIDTVILGRSEATTPESPRDAGQASMTIIKPTILKKDFWMEDFSQFSIICCYPMPTIMGRLEKKLMTELKPGARVLLNYFPFTHWKEKARKDNIFLYEK